MKGFRYAAKVLYELKRGPVLVMVIAMFLGAFVAPVEVWIVKRLIDLVQSWQAGDAIRPLLTEAGLLASLMAVSYIVLGSRVPLALTTQMELDHHEVPRSILQTTARLPLAAIESPAVQSQRERAMLASHYEVFQAGMQGLSALIQSLAMSAVIVMFGGWLPVVAAYGVACLAVVLSSRSTIGLEQLSREQTESRRLLRHYADLMTRREAAKEVRLFGLGETLQGRWADLFDRLAHQTWRAGRQAEAKRIGPELLMTLLSGVLLALVAFTGGAKLSAGSFALLLLALTQLLSQLTELVKHAVALRTQTMRVEDLQAYLSLSQEDNDDAERLILGTAPSSSGLQLNVRGVSFGYPGVSQPVLTDLTLTIPPGCRAALVGENGSGKSTLVKLLAGLYRPSEGEVCWRDSSGERMVSQAARDGFSAVFQDFAKLYLTLRENVALGKLSALADDDSLRRAMRDVGASSMDDLDVSLGAAFGGIEPSGGEWQRIVTARALLREAGFVFFDEPTAALDPLAEKEAFELFLRVTEGRSALIVTHRLGAARRADLIFVLKKGRLVEQGSHEDLLQRNGEYARMFRMQAAWYGEGEGA